MTTTLTIRDRRLRACHLFLLRGEIDLTNCPVLRARLRSAVAMTDRPVLVDVAEVGFCDAAGLNVFATAIRDAEAGNGGLRPVPFHLSGLRGRLATVFTLTGLDQALPVHPDLRSALRALRAAAAGPPRRADGPPEPG